MQVYTTNKYENAVIAVNTGTQFSLWQYVNSKNNFDDLFP